MQKAYPIALGISIAYLLVYILLGLTGSLFYFETGQEPIGSISGWCERVSGGIFREPSNALSNLGFISSSGGSNINADYFNIFSKSALFDYDTAKKINEFCQTKKDLGEITYYNLKKRRILTEYMNFDNVDIIDNPFASSYTYIKRIVVSKLGEGIAYASTFDIFPGDREVNDVDWWNNPGVIEGEVKYSKLHPKVLSIDVEDNLLCFGYFDLIFQLIY